MNTAIRLAVDWQMFHQEFSATHGAEDAVFKECWRRTWWMLYILDAYYAGSLGTMRFGVLDVEATVELPCEESDYESGVGTVSMVYFLAQFCFRSVFIGRR